LKNAKGFRRRIVEASAIQMWEQAPTLTEPYNGIV
jgi:hypothetical protein